MDVADRLVVLDEGRVQQAGAPRDLYDKPANETVLRFLGETTKVNGRIVRPHDVEVALDALEGGHEAMVTRVVHLGFEVRLELVTSDGEEARAVLTRHAAEELELSTGDVVFVRALDAPVSA